MEPSVVLSASIGKPDGTDAKLNIRLDPQGDGTRQPSDIVCVIDVSGSMGMEATIAGASGTAESHGLSLLDVAKHGVRTIANALSPTDRLAVVSFSHVSQVVFPLTRMDEAGKKLAEERLDELMPGGGTNIWDGLVEGLECLRTEKVKGKFGHVMFLTDGETQNRDTVIQKTMEYKAKHEGLPGSINTFGFGYNLDSRLLVDMANSGMGSYSFIPDAGFVGTAFVNMMSQLLATMAQDVTVKLDLDEGVQVGEPWGGWKVEDTGDFKSISVGSLQFGQSKDIVLPLKFGAAGPKALVNASFKKNTDEMAELPGVEAKAADTDEAERLVEEQYCRCIFVDALRETLDGMAADRSEEHLKTYVARINGIATAIKDSPASANENVQALLEDVMGQVTEAVSRQDWYWKWGCHYLPSVMFAHQLQICNNFKDPGVQKYGGKLFQALRDDADEIFCKIPAPKPTARRNTYGGGGGGGGYSAPVSMAAYHNASAVCVDGSSLATLATGEQRRVADLVRGDCVLGADGAEAELVCLVRSPCAAGCAVLVELSADLRLTPHHPVLVDGAWRFPADLAEASERPCEAVYSFVLKGAPAMCVGGVACAALGHGIDAGAAAHPYFATQKAIDDIAGLPDFKDGLVELSLGSVLRDPVTGLVCGITVPENTA